MIISGSFADCSLSISALPPATSVYVAFTGPAEFLPSHSPTNVFSRSNGEVSFPGVTPRATTEQTSSASMNEPSLRPICPPRLPSRAAKHYHPLATGHFPLIPSEPIPSLRERLFQIRNQILRVFEADRNPHCAGIHSRRFQFLLAHPVVRTIHRQHHQ